MQVGDQVIDLPLLQGHIEGRHHIAPQQDGLADPLVGRRTAAAGQVFFVEMRQARPLKRLVLVSVVADRAICLKYLLPPPLLRGERGTWPFWGGVASGGEQQRENQERGAEQNKQWRFI